MVVVNFWNPPTPRQKSNRELTRIKFELDQERRSGEGNLFEAELMNSQMRSEAMHRKLISRNYPRDFALRKAEQYIYNLKRRRENNRYNSLLNAHKNMLTSKQLYDLGKQSQFIRIKF